MEIEVHVDEFGLPRHVRNSSKALLTYGGPYLRWYERLLFRMRWWRLQQLGMKLALRRIWKGAR
jgi:hypothetical protein